MRHFNQEIVIKKFDLEIHSYHPNRLGNRILSNTFYMASFNQDSTEGQSKVSIGFAVSPHSDDTKGVDIKVYSHSRFNSEPKLTYEELTAIFDKSMTVLNETILQKLKEFHVNIPTPDFSRGQLLGDVLEQYDEY